MPATEKTEVWVFFDRENIYISARCWTAHPERIIANDMRRDGSVPRNDNIAVSLDTFRDRLHGYDFATNPLGARFDSEVNNDGQSVNNSWNAVWDVATGRFEHGWTVEGRSRSSRSAIGRARRRSGASRCCARSQWKNEFSYDHLPMPPAFGQTAHLHVSLSATLGGPGGADC